jgi:hypothetical protein
MTAQLAPTPLFRATDGLGFPLFKGQLTSYQAGTLTPQATYVDSSQTTQNTNPIILNARGEAQIWLDPTKAYKFALTDAFGNNIPGWPVDNIQGSLTFGSLTQQILGLVLYPRTAAETTAGVTPVNFFYQPLDPLRYGAIGDGTTDDTTAMNFWAAVVNASTTPNSVWTQGKTYLCGPITTITTNDLTLQMNGCTIKVKPNSWPSAVVHFNFTGVRTRIYAATIDGNQANFAAQQTGFLLVVGNAFLLNGVTVKNSPLIGMQLTNIVEGDAIGCHFDSNANVGAQFVTCSYLRFTNCTFNFNGYGFQRTYNLFGPNIGFAAFSMTMRFRCHHMTFTACESLQSGLDGFNVNQGSYAIKFIVCLAWGANDGGFTIAADNTSPGTPGNLESPYDLEYVDCEAYNNWGSGIAALQPVINLTVMGGRYYNNSRGAGTLAPGSYLFNGIYITSGSVGFNVKTKAYDDRQLCAITAVSGTSPRVLTATNWGLTTGGLFSATASQYPVVALFNAAMVFQGFGFISAESLGSVTITAATNTPVTLASIAAGWFVTQRVQFNGCFTDNNTQGQVDIDGFGFLTPASLGNQFGWKTVTGSFSNGQNVLVPGYPLDPNIELLVNPTFDAGVANWAFSQDGAGAAMTAIAAGNIRSAGGLQLTSGTAGANADATLATNYLLAIAGAYMECSVWAFAVNAADAELRIFWNPGSSFLTAVKHPGGSKWVRLVVSIFLPPTGNTNITFRLRSNGSGITNQFDSAYCRVRVDQTDARDTSYPSRNLPV